MYSHRTKVIGSWRWWDMAWPGVDEVSWVRNGRGIQHIVIASVSTKNDYYVLSPLSLVGLLFFPCCWYCLLQFNSSLLLLLSSLLPLLALPTDHFCPMAVHFTINSFLFRSLLWTLVLCTLIPCLHIIPRGRGVYFQHGCSHAMDTKKRSMVLLMYKTPLTTNRLPSRWLKCLVQTAGLN